MPTLCLVDVWSLAMFFRLCAAGNRPLGFMLVKFLSELNSGSTQTPFRLYSHSTRLRFAAAKPAAKADLMYVRVCGLNLSSDPVPTLASALGVLCVCVVVCNRACFCERLSVLGVVCSEYLCC